MRLLRGYAAAREAFLARQPLEQTPLPERMAAGLRSIFGVEISPHEAVSRILTDVRAQGDAALLDYTRRIDGAELATLAVSSQELEEAVRQTPAEVLQALEVAAARIRAFHERCRPSGWVDFSSGLGQLVRPLDRVGLYAPGGRAAYPSTVLMTAIPARVAGVQEIIVASPPDRKGRVHPLVLAAARIANVNLVFRLGGAQAIAAMAYGTATVPRVDKICGPGNLFVMLAKRAVFGAVGIDGLHGPSEAVVLADDSTDPSLCAADLLAQAEHDELASAVLITTSEALLGQVERELEHQLSALQRAETIRGALERNGALVLVENLKQGVELVNLFAPEHLSLLVQDPWPLVASIRHTGAIFLGAASSAALGDYAAGPSHVMPTEGTARFTSPLRVEDFLKITSLVALDAETARRLGPPAATLARAEGLTAHAQAIEARSDPNGATQGKKALE